MGFSYLNGAEWAQVTREERFFCAHLYGLLVRDKEKRILSCIRNRDGRELPRAREWEPAFEVCFYRDFSHHWKTKNLYSPKRTFDLCLFSEEVILIIEAKAQQPFHGDQLHGFREDCIKVRNQVGQLARAPAPEVWIIGLASSKYKPPPEVLKEFDGPLLTWRCLSELYDDDKVLLCADRVYDRKERGSWGKNNEGYMRGNELIEAHRRGEDFWVGRQGGLDGSEFGKDLEKGGWQTQQYETSSEHKPPNQNWFLLSSFAAAVEEA